MGNMATPPGIPIAMSNATNTAICQIDRVTDYAHRKSRVTVALFFKQVSTAQIGIPSALPTTPTIASTPIVTPLPSPAPIIQVPSSTATPFQYASPVQPSPTPQSSQVDFEYPYLVVYPSCNCEVPLIRSENILVRLRWAAKTSDLAERDLESINYILSLDGKPIQGIDGYRKPATFIKYPRFKGDPSDAWWIHWDYPLGQPTTWKPEHTIEATLVISAAIDTGWAIIPAGTMKTFRVTLFTMPLNPPPTPRP